MRVDPWVDCDAHWRYVDVQVDTFAQAWWRERTCEELCEHGWEELEVPCSRFTRRSAVRIEVATRVASEGATIVVYRAVAADREASLTSARLL